MKHFQTMSQNIKMKYVFQFEMNHFIEFQIKVIKREIDKEESEINIEDDDKEEYIHFDKQKENIDAMSTEYKIEENKMIEENDQKPNIQIIYDTNKSDNEFYESKITEHTKVPNEDKNLLFSTKSSKKYKKTASNIKYASIYIDSDSESEQYQNENDDNETIPLL
eukprot:101260_1